MHDLVAMAKHNNWANERLLEAAGRLPAEQLMAGTLSKGTVFDTLRHMLDTQWAWRMAIEGQPATEELWKIEPLESLAAVRAYWRADGQRLLALVEGLAEAALDWQATPSWSKQPQSVRHILLHIFHHGSNHRGEVGWHLHGLGCSPGDLDFLDFIDSQRPSPKS